MLFLVLKLPPDKANMQLSHIRWVCSKEWRVSWLGEWFSWGGFSRTISAIWSSWCKSPKVWSWSPLYPWDCPVTYSILFCCLFTIKDRLGNKACFYKRKIKVWVSCFWRCHGTSAPCMTHQTVSLYLWSFGSNARGESKALERHSVSSKSHSRVGNRDEVVAGRNGREK